MWDVLLGILIRQTFAPRRGGPQVGPPPAEQDSFLSSGCKNLVGVLCALTYGGTTCGWAYSKVKPSGKQVKQQKELTRSLH